MNLSVLFLSKTKTLIKKSVLIFFSRNCSLRLKIDAQSLDSEYNWFDYMATDSNSFSDVFLLFLNKHEMIPKGIIKNVAFHSINRKYLRIF